MTGIRLPLRFVVDSEGLQKNSGTAKLPLKKRLRIDMAARRQILKRAELVMTRVPSSPNCLTQRRKLVPLAISDRCTGVLAVPNSDMK